MEVDNNQPNNSAMDSPPYFRCPISMEVMKDPVTISTGVTYERKQINKWFHTYMKRTCPTTMQRVDNLDMTPNHTLRRLIQTWQNQQSQNGSSSSMATTPIKHDELVSLINAVESTPFKASSLKKLRSVLEKGGGIDVDFRLSGGLEVLIKIIVQNLAENSDFVTFRACEEAIAALYHLTISDETVLQLLMQKPECLKSMAAMLQRGSAEARFCAVSVFQKMGKADYSWDQLIQDQGIDFFKSLFEIASDQISNKACSSALKVSIQMLQSSKKCRLKAIEAGGVCTLIELIPESNRSKCEKIMHLIKLLCECPEGRAAFVEHGLGVAAVSKKLLNVSTVASRIGVKILWLICNYHPAERVLKDMLLFGAVKKLVALMHIDGKSSTRDRVVKIFKLHQSSWGRYPCFSREMQACLGLESDFC